MNGLKESLQRFSRAGRFIADQRTVSVGTTSQVLLPPNSGRVGLVLFAPAIDLETWQSASTQVAGADTNSTGNKLTYTCPSNRRAKVVTMAWSIIGGTPTVVWQNVIGGVTANVFTLTAHDARKVDIPLLAGETVSWRCTAAGGAGSTASFLIAAEEQISATGYTVSFAPTAVLGAGINVNPGDPPLILSPEWFG